jgi:hypothetical protein
MDTNLLQILVCFFGGLTCLLPIVLGSRLNVLDDSVVRTAVFSQRFRDFAVAGFSITIALVVESVYAILASLLTSKKSEGRIGSTILALLNKREQFIIALSIFTVPLLAFLPQNTPHMATLFLCLVRCRHTFVTGAIMTSLCRFDAYFWTTNKTYLGLTCLIFSNCIGVFADNISFDGQIVAQYTAITLHFSVIAIFFCCTGQWFRYVIPRIYDRIVKRTEVSKSEILSNSDTLSDRNLFQLWISVLYVVISILTWMLLLFTREFVDPIDDTNSDAIFYDTAITICYLFALLHISSRKSTYEFVEGLVSIPRNPFAPPLQSCNPSQI